MDKPKPKAAEFKPRNPIKAEIKNCAQVVIATLLYAVSTYIFVIGNNFAPSGLSGILAMIEYKYNLSSGTFVLLLLNLPLLIWSFFSLSKRFAIYTTLSVTLLCSTMFLFDVIDKEAVLRFKAETIIAGVSYPDFGKRLFCSIISGFCAGVSIAMTFRSEASLGGVDILVMLIQKKHPRANVSVLLFGVNVVIIIVSYFVFEDIEAVCFAVIYIVTFSKICELILKGGKQALKFEVITENPDELARELIEKLGHGVTVTNAKGMFANSDKYILICIIRNHQIGEFESILKKYPGCFAYVSSVSEVFGMFR